MRSLRSSTTMTRARRTGWNGSTAASWTTSRRNRGDSPLLLESRCRSDRGVSSDRSALLASVGEPSAPWGPVVADYVLGLFKDDGRHSWGKLGSGTLMARTEPLRRLGGFDPEFRRCAELDLAVRAALDGRSFHQR